MSTAEVKKTSDSSTKPGDLIRKSEDVGTDVSASASKVIHVRNKAKDKKLRHGKRRLEEEDPQNKMIMNFLKNPEYTQYRESNQFRNQEKIGRLEDCVYGCDFGILPMDLEWYIQAHPVLALITSFMLILSIILAVSSVGYIFRNIMTQTPNTFGWRSVASTYLIPLLYTSQANCSLHELQNEVETSTPYSHYICLGPLVLVQASSVVFLTWRSFKAYTLHIAVFFLRIQNWFIAIDLMHVCLAFIYEMTSLRSDMVYEMKIFTAQGVTGWWARTQKHSKCCGINGPTDWMDLKPTFVHITGQMFPSSCCDPQKSASKCADNITENDIYTIGCYTREKNRLQQHGVVLIVVMGWIIIVSIVLMYIFEGIEVSSRRTWKKSNSAFDSKGISIETFGSIGIIGMDGRKHYSKLILQATDFNQFTDGFYDFKYDYEYDIEVQRGEEIRGRAVVETSNISDRKLKLEMEFDEMKGLATIFY